MNRLSKPLKGFICYARQNSQFLEAELLRFLEGLKPKVEFWYDDRAVLGDRWSPEIETHLREAQIVILLISQDFLTSSYIQRNELPIIKNRLATNQIRVIGIIVEECLHAKNKWINSLQLFHPNSRAINSLPRRRRTAELKTFSEKIEETIDAWRLASRDSHGRKPLNGTIDKKRFLRRRCRHVPNASPTLRRFIHSILAEEHKVGDNKQLAREIGKIDDDYEKVIARAIYDEAVGRIEQMRKNLNEAKFSGSRECVRRFYRAIASEKLDKIKGREGAIDDLHWIVDNSGDWFLVRAAQFNLRVCFEKLNEFDKANFREFVVDRKFTFPNKEKLWHKAIVMEMIVCLQTKREFIYGDWIKAALRQQRSCDPSGYAKTLLLDRMSSGKSLSERDTKDLLSLQKRMPLNARGAVLARLGILAHHAGANPIVEIVKKEFKTILDKSRNDSTVLKHWKYFLKRIKR
jgi:hypothetical protein